MSSLSRELVFLILQFLEEEKYKDAAHKLERESGFYFNLKYFEDLVMKGDWEEVEKYVSGFTKVDENRYSMKIFFEIRKQKYLEALDKNEFAKAVEILRKDLKLFASFNEELFKEIALLLTLQDFRDNEQLSKYGDVKAARAIMLLELKKLIEANPTFRDKLQLPSLKTARLRTLINQSLNWQHQLCKNPKPNPDIRTLFVDHTCGQSSGGPRVASPVTNPLLAPVPKVGAFTSIGGHGPFQPGSTSAGATVSLGGGWMAPAASANPTSVPNQSASSSALPISLALPTNALSTLKRPRSPGSAMEYQIADSDNMLRRTRTFGITEEANNLPINILPISYSGQSSQISVYDFPKNVIVNLNQGSAIKSMDFHPSQMSLLLVGTNTGDVAIWEVGSREMVAQQNFKVWDISSCSIPLQASLANEYTASINRVKWSPDGNLIGVAYSKHIVHLYSYHGVNDLRNHLEIDAHLGNVTDLAFATPNKKLGVITCGEDKTIKVWDTANGTKLFTFEGHEAAIHSICPHQKANIQFLFSTATDGKIKAWLYDNMGSRVEYNAPGNACTTLAYSSDATRLFSCGTNKEGESFLVEWNECEGAVKRTYVGLGKCSAGQVVHFDTIKRFLVVGDESAVKVWDMDDANISRTIDAEGGLPASPCIRFNKEGSLLAVSTSDNGIKILANSDGVRMIRIIESRFSRIESSSAAGKAPVIATLGASTSNAAAGAGPSTSNAVADRNASAPPIIVLTGSDSQSLPAEEKGKSVEELEKPTIWKLTELSEPCKMRSMRLSDSSLTASIIRLMYTNSGNSILALAENAVHKLWKWQRVEGKVTGKATTSVAPLLWQPPSGIIMTNETSATNAENAAPCFALSKNDSYVMSASGGRISLFNMMSFKTMTTFMPAPPAASFLAFHPQDNNVVAIGMDDCTIQIYNVRVDEVKVKLKGHEKRVTGIAFSNLLSVMVSTGDDGQICVWGTHAWEKKANKSLQIPSDYVPKPHAHTRVQFHPDQKHVMVVHETQIGIYEASKLSCIKQWFPSSVAITGATYSCDGQSIFVCLDDGNVCVLTVAGLKMRCRINPGAYLPPNPSARVVHPTVIAAHPSEPNQFAVGLTDGAVQMMEPPEGVREWGTPPPPEEADAASTS